MGRRSARERLRRSGVPGHPFADTAKRQSLCVSNALHGTSGIMPRPTIRLLSRAEGWPRREVRPAGADEVPVSTDWAWLPAVTTVSLLLAWTVVAWTLPTATPWLTTTRGPFASAETWLTSAGAGAAEETLPLVKAVQAAVLARSIAASVMLVSGIVAILHSAAFASEASWPTRRR